MTNYQYTIIKSQLRDILIALDDKASLILSLITLFVTIIAVVAAYFIYRKQQKNTRIERIIILINKFMYYYYPLRSLFLTWKGKSNNSSLEDKRKILLPAIEVDRFQEILTEIEILAKITLKKKTFIELYYYLKYMVDLFKIGISQEDGSADKYKSKTILTIEEFSKETSRIQKLLAKELKVKTLDLENYDFEDNNYQEYKSHFEKIFFK